MRQDPGPEGPKIVAPPEAPRSLRSEGVVPMREKVRAPLAGRKHALTLKYAIKSEKRKMNKGTERRHCREEQGGELFYASRGFLSPRKRGSDAIVGNRNPTLAPPRENHETELQVGLYSGRPPGLWEKTPFALELRNFSEPGVCPFS